MHRNFGEIPPDSNVVDFKVERPKNQHERLNDLMGNIAEQLNQEAKERYGINNLLDAECQVRPEAFEGVHSTALLEESAEEVRKCELEFSGVNDPNRRAYYKKEYGIEGEEALVNRWKRQKETSKNRQMELVVTALLYKILSDRFFVVRTAKYDDYKNGVDNIIIDKKTGAVICAFDEVHEGGSGDRTDHKRTKIVETAHQGGAKLRFGLWIDGKELKRSQIQDLPVFYLDLSTKELDELTEQMEYDLNKDPSQQEQLIYQKLVGSVTEQFKMLSKEKLPPGVKSRLNKFSNSLRDLQKHNLPKKITA